MDIDDATRQLESKLLFLGPRSSLVRPMPAPIVPTTHELIQFPYCLPWGPKTVGDVDGRRPDRRTGERRVLAQDDPLAAILGLCFEGTASISFRSETANFGRIRQAEQCLS
jgi:hypothetical protein